MGGQRREVVKNCFEVKGILDVGWLPLGERLQLGVDPNRERVSDTTAGGDDWLSLEWSFVDLKEKVHLVEWIFHVSCFDPDVFVFIFREVPAL